MTIPSSSAASSEIGLICSNDLTEGGNPGGDTPARGRNGDRMTRRRCWPITGYLAFFSHPIAIGLLILAGFTVLFLAATCGVIVRRTR
jgi:hypothetical protein